MMPQLSLRCRRSMQLPAFTHCTLAQVSSHAAGAADDRRLGRSRAVSVVHCSAHAGEGHDHAQGFDVPLWQGPSSLQVLLSASHAVCMFPVPGMCQVLGVCCLCSIWALTCAKHRCARLHRHTTGPRCRQLVMHGAPGCCRQMPLRAAPEPGAITSMQRTLPAARLFSCKHAKLVQHALPAARLSSCKHAKLVQHALSCRERSTHAGHDEWGSPSAQDPDDLHHQLLPHRYFPCTILVLVPKPLTGHAWMGCRICSGARVPLS